MPWFTVLPSRTPAVGFYANLVNINAYHQPGVEAGKKAAAGVLELESKVIAALKADTGNKLSAEELAAKLQLEAQTEIIFKLLLRLAANDRGISSTAGATPAQTRFSAN